MSSVIAMFARTACVLEATARKPGNVHRSADFADTGYLDFVLSAAAIGDWLDPTPIAAVGVGATVLEGVSATRRIVGSNTNLGILLLLTPMAAVAEDRPVREGLEAVLSGLTVDDARAAYAAIRMAKPGGLGSSATQDIADEPTVTLLDAMRLAADRDAIARQYATCFVDVFETGLPALVHHVEAGRSLETAIVGCHLCLMAERPDTLIARKRGQAEAQESAVRARAVLDAGWPISAEGMVRFVELDGWLRAQGNTRNPGATADVVAAVLFAALREGVISPPVQGRFAFDLDNPALKCSEQGNIERREKP